MRSQRQRPCTERSAEDNSLGRENTLLPSWKNCIGCQWNSELITKSCPWFTNTTRVRRRNTCRNSFPDTFMHDPFSHHRNHAYWFQVLLKNTLKAVWFPSLFATLLPSSGMLYHKQSGRQTRRRFADVWKHPFCEWLCTMCLFLLLVYDFLSITPPPPPLSIRVNGNEL